MVPLVNRRAPLLPRSPSRLGALLVLLGLGTVGCGHSATRAECEEIFDRSAAIELRTQNVTAPGDVQERTAEARAAKGEELLRKCVGKRITDRAMRCVRAAESTRELEACLM
jgi:hypothetical protein